jgi:hypothetical protein
VTARVGDSSRFRKDLAPVAAEYDLTVAKVRTSWARKTDSKGGVSYDRQIVVTFTDSDTSLELPLGEGEA